MSLSFLSKKTWHTTNLKNVEKVWLAEQEQAKEQAKLEKWKKEREEERQIAELKELQNELTNTCARPHRKLVSAVLSPTRPAFAPRQEEGKARRFPVRAAPDERRGVLARQGRRGQARGIRHQKGVCAACVCAQWWCVRVTVQLPIATQVEVLPGSNFINGQNNLSNSVNEEFNKLTNDPLMMMRAEEQKALQRILSNPLKMKSIRGEVEKRAEKKSKKGKKEKKEKKHKKKEKKEQVHARSPLPSRSGRRGRRRALPAHSSRARARTGQGAARAGHERQRIERGGAAATGRGGRTRRVPWA